MKFIRRTVSSVLAAAVLAGACGMLGGCRRKGFGKDAEGKVKVVASIYPMYDFAKRIGGDLVAVNMLVPAGTEPHSWEPSTRDMQMLEEADLFVYNGAGIEAWADSLQDTVQNKNIVYVEASKEVALLRTEQVHHDADEDGHEEQDDHDGHHHHGEYDPHVWLSPKNAEIEMTAIAEALISKDPEHADTYRKNLEEAKKECEALDSAFADALKDYQGGYIVVAHEAYGYLCRDYGLKQIGIEGVSADQEPDAARMREIIDLVKEHGIKCIFFEELVDPKVAKSIADETGCTTMALSPLDGLTKEDIDSGRDYFSVMRDNLKALVSSFE
ncbi:MAG: zinc ABC transporter substrate-binding protein [Clostridiales bacterium]|nr:zinc ABC transporter substrate-binding protein [Clostridiales bacterium]